MRRAAPLLLLVTACADPLFPAEADTELSAGTGAAGGEAIPEDWLIVTSTDFSTGAVSIIETTTRTVRADLWLASTDAIPVVAGGRVFVLNRFMFDYVDVLDPHDDLRLLNQVPITSPAAESTNPHALAFAPDGRGFVGMYGAPELAIYDFTLPADEARLGGVDLAQFADADGIPEVDLVWIENGRVWAALQRLDRSAGWVSVAPDLLIAIDLESSELVDAGPPGDGSLGLPLPGQWPKQIRADPSQPGATLMLNDGVVRIRTDLSGAAQAEWLITPSSLASLGIVTASQPQSFALSPDGDWLFLAAYTEDFGEVRLHRKSLAVDGPWVTVADGLESVERSLEFIAGQIWFGDTTFAAPGVLSMDVDGVAQGARLDVGLAPYAFARAPAE